MGVVVCLVEDRLDSLGSSHVLVRQDQGVVTRGPRRVETQRELQYLHHEVADEAHEAVLVELLGGRGENAEAPGIVQGGVGLLEIPEGIFVGVQLEGIVSILAGLDGTQEVLAGDTRLEDLRGQTAQRSGGDRGSGVIRHAQRHVAGANPRKVDRGQTDSAREGVTAQQRARQFSGLALEVVGGDPVRGRTQHVVDDLAEVLLGLRLGHDLVEAQDVGTP